MVRFQGAQQFLPTTIISSLPEIVKRGILHPKVNEKTAEGIETRNKTISRLISMLDVRFINEDDKTLSRAEFGRFLQEYSLTAEEIFEAYRMAMKKELQNVKGETINVYPTLSLIQAGEILNAYKEFKISNAEHSRGISMIRQVLRPKSLINHEEVRREFMADLYEELLGAKSSPSAWMLYDELVSMGRINPDPELKRRLYRKILKSYSDEYEADVKTRPQVQRASLRKDFLEMVQSGKPNGIVSNRCKSQIVSKYLRKHLADFETFKAAIHG